MPTMGDSTELSVPAPGGPRGSQPAVPGTLRLATSRAPEEQRPHLLREFLDGLGIRCDSERAGTHPIEIDLTLQGLPGLQILSGKLQGTRCRPARQNNDPTEDVGLVVNLGGAYFLAQRRHEIV